MAKQATINAEGVVLGFYDTVDSPAPNPPPSGVTVVALTDAQWQEWLSNTSGLIWSDGELVANPDAALPAAQRVATTGAVAYYNQLIAGGFTSGGVLYDIDPVSVSKATGAGSAAAATLIEGSPVTWPVGFTYPSRTAGPQSLTAMQMLVLANNLFHFVAGAEANLDAIIASINGASTVEAVQAINVTAGYPAVSA
jgi:hypothetical protein